MDKNHWKTTLAGIALSVLNIYANGASGKQLAVSAAALVLGSLAADGRSTPTSPDPPAAAK